MISYKLTYNVTEAARLLGICRSHAYEMVRCGEIPAIRLGRRILIPRAAIESLLKSASSKDSNPDN